MSQRSLSWTRGGALFLFYGSNKPGQVVEFFFFPCLKRSYLGQALGLEQGWIGGGPLILSLF